MSEWKSWSKHVLKELERLDENTHDISLSLKQIEIDIATLKVKASVWGLLGGLIPAIAVFIWTITK